MNAMEITIVVVIVAAAVFFMLRRTIRKYRGAGSKSKSKNVSLTIGGEPMKRR